MNLVLFDLDKCASRRRLPDFRVGTVPDQPRAGGPGSTQKPETWEFCYRNYKAGTLDIHAFLDFSTGTLARHPRQGSTPAPRVR